jgi:Uma2 family endonuclease
MATASITSQSNAQTEEQLQVKPLLYTLEQYLQVEETAEERHEYFDGQIIAKSMARAPHNEIAANLIAALKNATKHLDKKYRIYSSNQKIYLPSLNMGLYPDAVVVSEKPEFWDDNKILLTNPLAIFEILSKSTGKYDQGGKFLDYQTLDSFQEYIILDQDKCQIQVFYREETDLWRKRSFTDLDAQLELRSIGCSLALRDIYEDVLE